MRFIAKFLLHHFVGNPEGRLEVKRSMTNLIFEGKSMLKETEDLAKSKIKFWLLAPFAWNTRNFKNPMCLFMTCTLVCMLFLVPFSIVKNFIYPMAAINLLHLLTPLLFQMIIVFLAIPVFLVFSIDAAIQRESEENYAWLRCWLVLTSYSKRLQLRSIEEIEQELTSLLEPVPPKEWVKIREKSKMLGTISLLLTLFLAGAWSYLMFSGYPLVEGWRETGVLGPVFLGSIVLAMAPGMFGIVQENVKKPVRVFEHDLHLVAERPKDGLRVTDALKNYEDEVVNKKLKRHALWFYFLGALCAWDLEKLEITVASSVSFSAYLLISVVWQDSSNNFMLFLRVFTALSAVLFVYTVAEAWINGGGKSKAMQRLSIIKTLKVGKTLSSIITFNSVLECFSSGSYQRSTKSATIEDYITRLYVKALNKGTKRA